MVLPLASRSNSSSGSSSPRSTLKRNLTVLHPALLFLAGCLFGRYYSYPASHHIVDLSSSSSSASTSVVVVKASSSRKEEEETKKKQINKNDGWNTIDVFYGSADTFVDDDKKQKNRNTSFCWYSQAHQDELVSALLLGNQTTSSRGGYFVDLAANDAQLLSNTMALERYFDFTGLCIEPNPMYWYNLSHMRPNCHIVGAVVGSPNRTAARGGETVYFRYNAGDHGGIAGDGFDNGRRWQKESEPAHTVPLQEILERYDAPTVIDYLSLDVEGAESTILLGFPFDSYTFKIITAERLKGPIRAYLKAAGYEFVQRLTRWGESLWVHSSFKRELHMEALERFNFPVDT